MRIDANSGPIIITAETITGEIKKFYLQAATSIVMPDSHTIISTETGSGNYAEQN